MSRTQMPGATRPYLMSVTVESVIAQVPLSRGGRARTRGGERCPCEWSYEDLGLSTRAGPSALRRAAGLAKKRRRLRRRKDPAAFDGEAVARSVGRGLTGWVGVRWTRFA